MAVIAEPAPGAGSVALFVSPHLDDVAFSAGGSLARLVDAGWEAHLHTVFSATAPQPGSYARSVELQSTVAEDADYGAARRAEDDAFARVMGLSTNVRHDLLDAIYRGYDSEEALFGPPRPGDDALETTTALLAGAIEASTPRLVFAPRALRGHVDHVITARAIARAAASSGVPVWWYADLPHAMKAPDGVPDGVVPAGAGEVAVGLGEVLGRKLDGVGCYATQVVNQFGEDWRARIEAFAAAEGRRCGMSEPAEVFLAEDPGGLG